MFIVFIRINYLAKFSSISFNCTSFFRLLLKTSKSTSAPKSLMLTEKFRMSVSKEASFLISLLSTLIASLVLSNPHFLIFSQLYHVISLQKENKKRGTYRTLGSISSKTYVVLYLCLARLTLHLWSLHTFKLFILEFSPKIIGSLKNLDMDRRKFSL